MTTLSCQRCLLTQEVPGVYVDAGGICSVCNAYDTRWGEWDEHRSDRLAQLDKILDSCRGSEHPYEALIPLSGGKDSTYVLYMCRERFGLRCLAVTFDNGFMTDYARKNVERAVSALAVDHVYFRVNRQLLMHLYRFFLLETGLFCPVCMRGIEVAVQQAASAFRIPLVISGTSTRTEEHVAREFFQGGDLRFFKEVLKGSPLEPEAAPLMSGLDWVRMLRRAFTYTSLALPDYLEWDYEEIYRRISTELGWTAARMDAEHSDCQVAEIVDYFRYVKFPPLVPEMLRFSKLVTAGQMTREEARRKVTRKRAEIAEPKNLEQFLTTLGVTRQQLDDVLAEPLRHMKYLRPHGRTWDLLRMVRRLLANAALGLQRTARGNP